MTDEALIPPDFDVEIRCGLDVHAIAVRAGMPVPTAHTSDQERVLAALSPEAPACVRYCAAARSGFARSGERANLPELFVRLGALLGLRRADAPSVERRIKQEIGTSLWRAGMLRSAKVIVGDDPHVERRGKGIEISVARDWLARAWLFGIEEQSRGIVIGVRARGAREVEVSMVERDPDLGARLARTTMSAPDLYAGFPFHEQART